MAWLIFVFQDKGSNAMERKNSTSRFPEKRDDRDWRKMMTGVNGGSTERQIGRKIVRIKVLFILEPRNALRIQRQLLLS